MTGGKMLRPKAEVLADAALVPPRNLVTPPPECFTHVLTRDQPWFYDADAAAKRAPESADGHFTHGMRVVLMARCDAEICRVVDERGLYVATAYAGLAPLP